MRHASGHSEDMVEVRSRACELSRSFLWLVWTGCAPTSTTALALLSRTGICPQARLGQHRCQDSTRSEQHSKMRLACALTQQLLLHRRLERFRCCFRQSSMMTATSVAPVASTQHVAILQPHRLGCSRGEFCTALSLLPLLSILAYMLDEQI